MILSIRRKFNW